MTNNCSHSVDFHFQVVAILYLAFLHTEVAFTFGMGSCRCIAIGLLKTKDETLLTLPGWSFLVWGNRSVACYLGFKPSQYYCFEKMRLCSPLIADIERLILLDSPLVLILTTSQRSLYALSLDLKFIQSLLTSNISFLCVIICIQKLHGHSISDPPQFLFSEIWMK